MWSKKKSSVNSIVGYLLLREWNLWVNEIENSFGIDLLSRLHPQFHLYLNTYNYTQHTYYITYT